MTRSDQVLRRVRFAYERTRILDGRRGILVDGVPQLFPWQNSLFEVASIVYLMIAAHAPRMMKLQTLCLGVVAVLSLGTSACKKAEPPPAPTAADQVAPAKPAERTVAPAPGAGDPKLAPLAGRYELDETHSAVMFRIKHMNVSHSLGRFNKVTGSLVLDGDLSKSKVEIRVDPASIYTADKKRDDHLRSPDFLNVGQFPAITFTSTAIKATGEGFEVTGDLGLHGVTKPVTASFELVGSGKHAMDESMFLVGFTGELEIKRSEFGMTNMIGPVGDDLRLTIAIEAVKK